MSRLNILDLTADNTHGAPPGTYQAATGPGRHLISWKVIVIAIVAVLVAARVVAVIVVLICTVVVNVIVRPTAALQELVKLRTVLYAT